MDAPSGGFKPQLKKIKRPINRQAPQTSARPSGSENVSPFASYVPMSGRKPEVDINDYLDEKPLPSKEVHDIPESADHPQYIDEEAYEEEVYGRRSTAKVPDWLTMKVFFLIISVSLFVGIVAGRFIFAESKIVRNGLQGVVVNAEVPRGRARCGVAERTQGCVLYIMNPQRQEMRAKDFYDLAAQMTGRQRFMIETGNMRYANSKIRAGDIVQLNIPPL